LEFGGRSIYDPRLERFISIDPRDRDFPYMSPYCFAANTPIIAVDEDGEGPIIKFFRSNFKKLFSSNHSGVISYGHHGKDHGDFSSANVVVSYDNVYLRSEDGSLRTTSKISLKKGGTWDAEKVEIINIDIEDVNDGKRSSISSLMEKLKYTTRVQGND
jgi:hypothetical protein